VLKQRTETLHAKAKSVDLSAILFQVDAAPQATFKCEVQDHGLEDVLDRKLISQARTALEDQVNVSVSFPIVNTDRAVGAMLSHEISKAYGKKGLPDGTIDYRFRGSAGQSFGAFLAKGIHFTVEGDTNDYFGKGLSGGQMVVVPDRDSTFEPGDNIIVGNVGLYGATSGNVFIRGKAGERFAVRNSGATAVVEGVGAHGCEYMTGGDVIIQTLIGQTTMTCRKS